MLFMFFGLEARSDASLDSFVSSGNCPGNMQEAFAESFPSGEFIMDCYRYCFSQRSSDLQRCVINQEGEGTSSVNRQIAQNLSTLLALIDNQTPGGVYWSDNTLTSSTTLTDLVNHILARGQSDLCGRLEAIAPAGLTENQVRRLNSTKTMINCNATPQNSTPQGTGRSVDT